jgi:threonine aldolase
MSNRLIDLRSDTITRPTAAMRQVMAEAEVGDDVFGDDSTVNELERRTAELLGKEAAVYVPSGTMANQLAVRCHTQPGDEILLDANAHIYWYEAGAPEALSGVRCRVLPGERGIFTAEQVRTAFRPLNIHLAPTRLLALENTHNRGGGSIWPLPRLEEVCAVARDAGIFTHLDGARLWNASVATGIAEADYAKSVDSVSVCFSKGLGAPVGSALAGSAGFVKRARRFRKQFGGGMRQAGIIAAGALYALDHHRQRLEDDHANARQLAAGLNGIPGLRINSENVDTNIVYFDIENQDAAGIVNRLTEMNVLVLTTGPNTVRAVTSLEVDADDIEKAVEAVREVMTSSR